MLPFFTPKRHSARNSADYGSHLFVGYTTVYLVQKSAQVYYYTGRLQDQARLSRCFPGNPYCTNNLATTGVNYPSMQLMLLMLCLAEPITVGCFPTWVHMDWVWNLI